TTEREESLVTRERERESSYSSTLRTSRDNITGIRERESFTLLNEPVNIYESGESESPDVRRGTTDRLSAAVLFRLLQNVHYILSEEGRRARDNWYEFRNLLYRSAENTFERLQSAMTETAEIPVPEREITEVLEMLFPEAGGEGEALAGEGNLSQVQTEADIIEQIKHTQETLSQSTNNYRKMLSLLERARNVGRRRNRARAESRRALRSPEESREAIERLEREEEEGEQERQEILREVTELFPNDSVRVFEAVEQVLNQPETTFQDISVVQNNVTQLMQDIEMSREAGQAEELIFSRGRDETAEALEELRQLTGRREQSGTESAGSWEDREKPPIVHRRTESLSQEDVEEILSQNRRNVNRVREERESQQSSVEYLNNVTRTVAETGSVITEEDREDIAEMVSRGVRSQMGSISDEVLRRLEKRLRNEKSRRGI
ncbi:MAG: hypothetical protein K5989_04970, partial [Lachnospiraceae bacterium]|nr:hypothetical protein [Lachnospiraceae bacterium]